MISATDLDRRHLSRALALARRGRDRVSPNPMVGCVLTRDGQVIGTGYHRRVGGPHAEIEALRDAGGADGGDGARGAAAYVTLEPCDHTGRTPPCSKALIAAGVGRVVACHADPNPAVAGKGFDRLRAAGIDVVHDVMAKRAVQLNWQFLVAMVHRRPAVTLKWAMSLDGKIATATGDSQWISSPGGRRWGLGAREHHDAILVGINTALADDPRLNRRLERAATPIVRVVLDRRLRLPVQSRLFDIDGPVLVYTTKKSAQSKAETVMALEARGATVTALDDAAGTNPPQVLEDLYQRGIRSLLVEGGGTVAASFVAAGLYDRVMVDCAPLMIGGAGAVGPLGEPGVERLCDAPRLDDLRARRRDGDLLISGFRSGCLPDLFASVVSS